MRIVLLGLPGAGKGTQAGRILDRFGGVHIATGDILRSNAERGTELGRTASQYMDRGELVPDDVIIDMVLELNRDLVLRRLVECLGRDRTKHQVAEVTSLGLVQMTRKRIGTGLLEAFSENCEHCQGRGVIVHDVPVEPKRTETSTRKGCRSTARRWIWGWMTVFSSCW